MTKSALLYGCAVGLFIGLAGAAPALAQMQAGEILVVDPDAGSTPSNYGRLFRVNPVNGTRTVLTEFNSAGTGGQDPRWIAIERNGGILIVDQTAGTGNWGALIRIDPGSGAALVLSDFGNETQGPPAGNPQGVAVEANGHILVVDPGAATSPPTTPRPPRLFRIDPETGNRTVLTDFGINSGFQTAIAIERNGQILVLDQSTGNARLLRVDPITGAWTVLNFLSQGVNPANAPHGIAVEASGAILVIDVLGTDGRGALFRFDPQTGNRVRISDFGNPAQGAVGDFPQGVTVEANGRILVTDQFVGTSGSGALFSVDPVSGHRELLSDFGVASQGPTGLNPFGVAVFSPLPNTPPTITSSALTRWPATSGSFAIAAVNDAEDGPGFLSVSIRSANPSNGVTLSGVSNNDGSVTATVAVAAGASSASFVLRVTDALGDFAESTFNVSVIPPVSITPNISPAPNANGWNNGPVTVSWTVANSTLQSGCGTTTLSAETTTAGTTLTCSAANDGGTTSGSVAIKIDLTPPTGTASRTPMPNASGWTNTDVTANFTCTDELSGAVSTSSSQTITTEGAAQSRDFVCADVAGNSVPLSVTGVNIDKTAPTGTASRTPLANANGWSNTDVTANFTCADGLSGLVAAGSSQPITTEGVGQSRDFVCLDLAGNSRALSVTGVNIDKSAPVVEPASIVATPNPVAVNTAISLAASLADTGPSNLALSQFKVDSGAYTLLAAASGASANVTGSIGSFASAGVLNVCVRASDLAGNQSQEECILIAVYDPSAGYVTGAGTFESPIGALVGSTATGTARFGFQSKYARGATVPSGSTTFKFRAADFEFDSTSYEWLVVSGARAQYKGTGVIKNRAGTFNFLLTVIDGDQPGGGGLEKFRIKISDSAGVIYDNQMGAADSADPSTVIASGHIVIRK